MFGADLHGGLFGHVDAGATDDGVRRGIETLSATSPTWSDRSKTRRGQCGSGVLRARRCVQSTTWTGSAASDGDLLRRRDGGAVGGRQRRHHACQGARTLRRGSRQVSAATAVAADATSSSSAGSATVLMKGRGAERGARDRAQVPGRGRGGECGVFTGGRPAGQSGDER